VSLARRAKDQACRMAAVASLLLLACSPAVAGTESLEHPVKAEYLVKFAAFVEWPRGAFPSDDAPITICVHGADPFGPHLDDAAAAHTVAGRPVVARRLARIDARSGCHVAYLGRSREQTLGAAMAALRGAPVLVVTDQAWTRRRGMIHFVVVRKRVRFHIDDHAARRARLSISSRLLSLALSVKVN